MAATKMMRWRPWPPLLTSKFHVKLLVASISPLPPTPFAPLVVEVCWKGPKSTWPPRRSLRRNITREAHVERPELGGSVEWNEEFQCDCTLTTTRDGGGFYPWEISFAFVNGSKSGPKDKPSILGTASLNLADFASGAKEKTELSIPLSWTGANLDQLPFLHLKVNLVEVRTVHCSSEITQGTVVPAPTSPINESETRAEKDEVSSLMRKVKIFTDIMSNRKPKKTCREDEGSEGRSSARSDDAEYTFDTDSLGDDLGDGETEDGKNPFNIRKSFSYGSLASANHMGGSFYSETMVSNEFEDGFFYNHRKSDVGCSNTEASLASSNNLPASQTMKSSLLPWKKRKLSFRSTKIKGVPLLNKEYGEEGGDDIDFVRRQMNSDHEFLGKHRDDGDSMKTYSSMSDFGDDNFVVGSWETKEVVSRDGHMKISTQLFFASIDQRSERAAGESACTVLVAVIGDWFHNNQGLMPNQSQFDGLIRDGSLAWRNLCDNEVFQERFPDKHFDLETVLHAGIRPLSVVPSKSFIGFFHPGDLDEDNSTFSFLHGAMSFDSIWDEICHSAAENIKDSHLDLYIVSWNDHLFALKVEPQAYYIIDTLGERLHEGCDRAYILKFDENTVIRKMPREVKAAADEFTEPSDLRKDQSPMKTDTDDEEKDIVCKGKESCREYIKNFLAAIPIRELEVDIKKGKMTSTVIHQRLQIEFHYAQLLKETS